MPRRFRGNCKGPFMPSMVNPPVGSGRLAPPQRALPAGKVWLRHNGKRQRLKNLRQFCAPILKATDAPTVQARAAIVAACAQDPEPEYAQLNLIKAALDASEGTGVEWHWSATYLLKKFSAGAS